MLKFFPDGQCVCWCGYVHRVNMPNVRIQAVTRCPVTNICEKKIFRDILLSGREHERGI